MGIEQYKDVESGGEEANGLLQDLQEPFIQQGKHVESECDDHNLVEKKSIAMVLLSTFVAVCGSFAFGTCVSFFVL